jgi:hypothetical protein
MTPLPRRLQLSRRKGFNLQEHSRAVNGLPAVNCARPGLLGNPFVVGIDGTVAACVRLHKILLGGMVAVSTRATPEDQMKHRASVAAKLDDLRGKNLACWCRLCLSHKAGKPLRAKCIWCAPCHCDALGILANAPRCEEVRAG